MDKMMQGIPENKDIVIGGGVNVYIGNVRVEYERVHGGYRFGEMNEAGEKVLDIASSYELVIIISNFRK
jgi:hypothetical protein